MPYSTLRESYLHVSILFFQLESEKNKLENLLNNNLMKKKERIFVDLQEMSSEERKQRLEMVHSELETVNARISDNNAHFKSE